MVNRINLILQAKNLSSKQFAEEIGVQPSGLSHILSGRNNPSLDFMMKVVNRYPEIDIKWLMFGRGEMYDQGHRQSVSAPSASTVQAGQVRPAEASPIVNAVSASPSQVAAASVAPQPPVATASKHDKMSVPELDFGNDSVSNPSVETSAPTLFSHTGPVVAVPVAPPASVSGRVGKTMPRENPKNETASAVDSNFPIFATTKKIVKIVVLYDDKTFTEYFPE